MSVAISVRSTREVTAQRPTHGVRKVEQSEALHKSSIAELSAALIAEMTCEELCRVIRAADLPTLGGIDIDGRLTFYDRPTLVRLAHLARRCCQTLRHRDPSGDGSH